MPDFALILPAAGRSVRFGTDKLMQPLAGRPVLARSLGTFLRRADLAAVVMPCRPRDASEDGSDPFAGAPAALRQALADPRVRLCAGGASRAESVYNGLREVPEGIEW